MDGEKALEVYDVIRTIQDPEKPSSLEELGVVSEGCVEVQALTEARPGENEEEHLVVIRFTPTVPHCSLATLIDCTVDGMAPPHMWNFYHWIRATNRGLCLRVKLERCLPFKHKLEIYIAKGTHATEHEINKQINDKERIAAAMENPNLREIVENCVKDLDE